MNATPGPSGWKPSRELGKPADREERSSVGELDSSVEEMQTSPEESSSLHDSSCSTSDEDMQEATDERGDWDMEGGRLKRFACNICGKSYSYKNCLKRHKLLHKETVDDKEKFSCTLCGHKYSRREHLTRHMDVKHNINGTKLVCDHCKAEFKRKDVLLRHIGQKHSDKTYDCDECSQRYKRVDDLKAHKRLHKSGKVMKRNGKNKNVTHKCVKCEKVFKREKQLLRHQKKCNENVGNTDEISPSILCEQEQWTSENACDGAVAHHTLHIHDVEDLEKTLSSNRDSILALLRSEFSRLKACKWYISACIEVRLQQCDTITDTERHLRSKNKTFLKENVNQINDQIGEAIMDIFKQFDMCADQGSGMIVLRVISLELFVAAYNPLRGSSYLPLPEWLNNANLGLINIQNFNDDKCFLWCVILGVLLQEGSAPEHNKQRVNHYFDYQDRFTTTGMSFPVRLEDIHKFEKLNDSISVNVFGLEDEKHIVPQKIARVYRDYHINLLLLKSEDRESHYVLISNKSKFLSHLNKHNGAMFWCDFCLHAFTREKDHDDHRKVCILTGPQKTTLPVHGKHILKFKDLAKRQRHDYVIYADFESVLVPIQSCANDPTQFKTRKVSEHMACGFGYIIIGPDGKIFKEPVIYHGTENIAKEFLLCLQSEVEEIEKIRKNYPIHMTQADEESFEKAKHCYLCGVEFSEKIKKVRDHDHEKETQNFRGASCNNCNLGLKRQSFVPCFFHNLQSYDAHLLIQEIGMLISDKRDVSIIPKTKERYISFSWKKLRFLDSLQFLPASLDKLSQDLELNSMEVLKYLEPDIEKRALLKRKGVYPYEYFSDVEKFNEDHLPQKSDFYSSLCREHISDDDYNHAQKVWDIFDMETLWDYHDLYLKTDVVLLADVMENFRNLTKETYDLDPAHFYTTPGLAWSAALLKSNVQIELLSDIDMHLFIERGIRGGVASINYRYCEANNKYIPDTYDESKDDVYIMYLDANNLYGGSLRRPLPISNFRWLTEIECQMLNVMNIEENDRIGRIFEVDLCVPCDTHDKFNDYPLAPEHMVIDDDELSPYQQRLRENLGFEKSLNTQKLVPNLKNKKNYVVYGTTLKQYVQLGLKITKIHRVLEFLQSPWLRTYVDFNTKKRQEATSSFSKNYFKLMVNAVFGKTIEGVRNRKNVYLCKTRREIEKLVARPTFDSFTIFDHKLVAVECKRNNIHLEKPIFVGMVVLDVAKEIMYDFHYNCMKKVYKDKCIVMGGDTDSIFYRIETKDVYKDMKEKLGLSWFDTSDYPTNHPLYSLENKKVIGKFKDEMNGEPIKKFVGLKAKMYAFEKFNCEEKKVAKGVDRACLKKDISLEDYVRCMNEDSVKNVDYVRIGTDGRHHIFTIKGQKRALSAYDDKRYILEDGISTYAYGHYKIDAHRIFKDDDNNEMDDIFLNLRDDGDDEREGKRDIDEGEENLKMLISLMDM